MNCFLLLAAIPLAFIFHSGRTDSEGGHYNRSTGEHHYHSGPYSVPDPPSVPEANEQPRTFLGMGTDEWRDVLVFWTAFYVLLFGSNAILVLPLLISNGILFITSFFFSLILPYLVYQATVGLSVMFPTVTFQYFPVIVVASLAAKLALIPTLGITRAEVEPQITSFLGGCVFVMGFITATLILL